MNGDSYETPPFPEREKKKKLVLYKGQSAGDSWISARGFQAQGYTPEYSACLDSTTCASALIKEIGND